MTEPITEVDVVVVGGGMAGVSVAAALATRRRVVLVEQEAQLAHHATGRSAASWVASYGPAPVRALTRASRPALDAIAPDGVAVLSPRPILWMAFDDEAVEDLEREVAEVAGLERLGPRQVHDLHPALRGARLEGALESGAQDVDVLALHQHYVRSARHAGVAIWPQAEILGGDRAADGRLVVDTSAGALRAAVVVDAAGAWADVVATRLGAAPMGLRPLRRTVAIARPSRPVEATWPFVLDVTGRGYCKPEGPNVLVSPADETLQPPGDARPEELDIALALDCANEVTDLGLRSVLRSWAGLRTFAPDGVPVVGFDPEVAGLFWCAGQGGYGIQLAPALAELAAAELLGEQVPDHLLAEGVEAADLRPRPGPAAPPAPA